VQLIDKDDEVEQRYAVASIAQQPSYFDMREHDVQHNTLAVPVLKVPIVLFYDDFLALGQTFTHHSSSGTYWRYAGVDARLQTLARHSHVAGVATGVEWQHDLGAHLLPAVLGLERGCYAHCMLDGQLTQVCCTGLYKFKYYSSTAGCYTVVLRIAAVLLGYSSIELHDKHYCY
jgi:hypothetical protein